MRRRDLQAVIPLKIGGIIVEQDSSFDYLGFTLDETLSMSDAINKAYVRASHKLYLLGLIRKYLDKKGTLRIFKALVMPYIEYSCFPFSASTDKLIVKLQRLQNRGLRVCLRAEVRRPIAEMHQDCKILYIKHKIELKIIKVMYRRIHRQNCSDPRSL